MPYKFRKLPKSPCYRVFNCSSRKVFSKCTTKENAIRQVRLLRAIKYNRTFRWRNRPRHPTRRNRISL